MRFLKGYYNTYAVDQDGDSVLRGWNQNKIVDVK